MSSRLFSSLRLCFAPQLWSISVALLMLCGGSFIPTFSSISYSSPIPAINSHQAVYSQGTWARPGARFYIKHGSDIFICTVGFPASNSHGDHLFITAGHCAEPGDMIFEKISREPLEHIDQGDFFSHLWRSFTGMSSVLRLRQVGRFIMRAGASANGSVEDIGIVQLLPNASLPGGYRGVPINMVHPTPGMSICKVGTMSGRTCGKVIATNRRIHPDNYRATLLTDSARICIVEGDSGGPVITNGAAVGLVSAGEDIHSCAFGYVPESYITDIAAAMAVLQARYPSLHLV